MTETEMKLRDAATQMKLGLEHADDEAIVRSCVNSFISLGRSVTFVMQRESSGSQELADWYDARMKQLRDSPLLRFFNDRRVYSIHKGVVIPRQEVLPIQDFRENGIPRPEVTSATFLRFDEAEQYFPGRSGGVFRMCEEYFLILRQLVHDWLLKRKELGIE